MPMSYRLKNYHAVPPGNYFYVQSEGLPNPKPVDSSPVIYDTAWKVLDLRKGNSLPRATIEESLEDVDNFTVARLIVAHGTNNEWVYNTDRSFGALHPAASIRSCSSCGAKVS